MPVSGTQKSDSLSAARERAKEEDPIDQERDLKSFSAKEELDTEEDSSLSLDPTSDAEEEDQSFEEEDPQDAKQGQVKEAEEEEMDEEALQELYSQLDLLRKRMSGQESERTSQMPSSKKIEAKKFPRSFNQMYALVWDTIYKNFTWSRFFGAVYAIAICSYLYAIALESQSRDVTFFLFHRFMAILYAISFISIGSQIIGLCGENGILPIKETMMIMNMNKKSKLRFPTAFWWRQDDKFINALWMIGLASSALYFLNIVPTLFQIVCFISFLSFKTVGREFFALQFDNLILDASVLAILLPPVRLLPFLEIPTSSVYRQSVAFLIRWLGFRLLLGSGLCKIMSGDKTWKQGTALLYHYWSQPMPSWVSYYADRKLGKRMHWFSCHYHFFVELVSPFAAFFPPLFVLGFLAETSLQMGILLTGNYGTFNLISIALPFTLLHDAWMPSWFVRLIQPLAQVSYCDSLWLRLPLALLSMALVGAVLAMSAVPLEHAARDDLPIPKMIVKWQSRLAPWGLMNYYGLFARMTTSRRDIIIEGSNDGQEWQEYEFKYKLGDVKKRPPYVIGHLPRLDWRMWFAQFAYFNSAMPGWFDAFLMKLLEGSKDVLGLLEKNPFPEAPPRFLRCTSYEYRFAKDEQRKKGMWWDRSQRKMYWPPCTLSPTGKLLYLSR